MSYLPIGQNKEINTDAGGKIILAYMPTTLNQAVFGTMTVKEY